MTKKERAKIVMTELEKIYPEVPIPLNHRNAYELLVAVALSAQTTDKKVNEVTPKLFSVAPNIRYHIKSKLVSPINSLLADFITYTKQISCHFPFLFQVQVIAS